MFILSSFFLSASNSTPFLLNKVTASLVSKKVPAKTAYLATKEAVTLFNKKGVELEADRKKEERINTEITRKVCLVALTDATKAVKITVGALRAKKA